MISILKAMWSRVSNLFAVPRMIYSMQLPKQDVVLQGLQDVGQLNLIPGRWLIVAKTSVIGQGDATQSADCRLKVFCDEAGAVVSDESYAWVAPMQAATIVVMMQVTLQQRAQVTLQVGALIVPAGFKHLRLSAIRDVSA